MTRIEDGMAYIIDDWRICEALEELMAASGLAAAPFLSAGGDLTGWLWSCGRPARLDPGEQAVTGATRDGPWRAGQRRAPGP
jgi:hypothetical protein